MIIKVVREYTDKDRETIELWLSKKYGSIERLKKDTAASLCELPDMAEDLFVWSALRDGEEFLEEVIIEDPKFFNALTERRMEILEFINKHRTLSIREISAKTKRDYKNVYDDVVSLKRFFLINYINIGRKKAPVGVLKSIEIEMSK